MTAILAHALAALVLGLPAASPGVWPLAPHPPVVEGFSPPEQAWSAGHRGVDLAGRPGQQVRTALAGVVSFAGRIAGRGVVVVRHGSDRTTYEPVAASVAVGDVVAAGDVLGTLQLFGSHCWPAACLHWGLIEGAATYRDPMVLVGAGPVRLLPLTGAPTPAGKAVGTATITATIGLPAPVPPALTRQQRFVRPVTGVW